MHTAVDAPVTHPLEEKLTADITIVGAGFTGLNAALYLAQRGFQVVVLESANLGFGASGRSGGQVNLGLNASPSELLQRFGTEQGQKTIDLVVNTPDRVFQLIKKHQLNCDAVQNGWVQAATTDTQVQQQQTLAQDYAKYNTALDVLDGNEVEQKAGAQGYRGGLFCPTAGSLHPLSYTRELARVALQNGAKIFTNSGVQGLAHDGKQWRVATGNGEIRSEKVLICTNGYTGKLVNGLESRVVPVRSVLIASEPLGHNLRNTILPGEITFVDKRRLILYARYDRDGRLCVGDHGPMRDVFYMHDFDALKKRVTRIFPQLSQTRWDFHWGGRIAVTKDSLPFLYEAAPGLIAAMGYNGRGVGMGSMMGQVLAETAIDRSASDNSPDDHRLQGAFPVTSPKSFALHRFNAAGVSMAVKWYALMDHLETRQYG